MIRGRRTVLRPLDTSDSRFLSELNADPEVRRNVVGWDWPRGTAEQERWLASLDGATSRRFVVESHEGEPIGLTGLWEIDIRNRHAYTGLKLGGRTDVRGQGLGTDAVLALMAFAFYDVGLERLYSDVMADNLASLRVYCDKAGWKKEGTARRHVWRDGRWHDVVHIGCLRSDFDEHPDGGEYRDAVRSG